MRIRARSPLFRATALASLVALAACGKRAAADPNDREVSWTYGPTTGGASLEHVQGTGGRGGAAIARGWQCRLVDGKRLVVRPFQLASSHPLFGKVVLSLNLFDKAGKPLTTLTTGTVTAANASFTLDVDEAIGKQLHDLVIYYRSVS